MTKKSIVVCFGTECGKDSQVAEPSRIEFVLEMRTAQEIAPMSLFAFFEAFTVPAQLVQNLMSAVV